MIGIALPLEQCLSLDKQSQIVDQCHIQVVCLQFYDLDVLKPLRVETDNVLGAVALRSHLKTDIDLIVAIVPIAEPVV